MLAAQPFTHAYAVDIGSAYLRVCYESQGKKDETLRCVPSFYRIEVREYESHGVRERYNKMVETSPAMTASILSTEKMVYEPRGSKLAHSSSRLSSVPSTGVTPALKPNGYLTPKGVEYFRSIKGYSERFVQPRNVVCVCV